MVVLAQRLSISSHNLSSLAFLGTSMSLFSLGSALALIFSYLPRRFGQGQARLCILLFLASAAISFAWYYSLYIVVFLLAGMVFASLDLALQEFAFDIANFQRREAYARLLYISGAFFPPVLLLVCQGVDRLLVFPVVELALLLGAGVVPWFLYFS